MSVFALNDGQRLVVAEGLAKAMRANRPNREDSNAAADIIEILLKQRLGLLSLANRFLSIDDWVDEDIAPRDLIEASTALLTEIDPMGILLREVTDAPPSVIKEALDQQQQRIDDIRREFNLAIDFTLDEAGPEGLTFLQLWREGCWPEIAEEFPGFKGSDTEVIA